MTLTMNSFLSRMLALFILVLIIVLVLAVTVMPVWSANRHYENTIESMQERLEQLQRAAAIGARLQPQHAQLTRWQTDSTHFLKSESDTLAAAELQRLVKQVAASNGAEILSSQILPPRQEQAFTQVGIKVRMRTTLDILVPVFHTLETSEPFLFLDKISLHSRLVGRRRAARISSPQRILDVDFELTGYLSPQS